MRPQQRGAAMVELALVSIPMLLIALAVLDVARAMYAYQTLVKATRDATRMLSGYDPTVPTLYPVDEARALVVFGAAAPPGAKPMLPGLTVDLVQVCDRATPEPCGAMPFRAIETGTGTIDLVAVQVNGYEFRPWFPGARVLPRAVYTFGPIRTTMRQIT
jgi:hypothetical protein